MLTLSVLLSATLLSGAVHTDAAASGAIPPWARKYNVSCSHCHLGANPTLNATGIRFRWAGYRMPEDIGQNEEAKRVSDYVGARAKFRYTYEKTSGQSASSDDFALDETNLYFSGAFARNFGAFVELAAEGGPLETEMVTMTAVWGNEQSSHGFRFGQQKAYEGAGVAGFDRRLGLATPIPLSQPVTSTTDFRLKGQPSGAEAFFVKGSNRLAVSVYTSQFDGTTATKDLGVNDQFLLDDLGSAIEVLGYYGTQTGLDPSQPTLDTHVWRLGVSASKVLGTAERNLYLIGTYVYGNDVDLPTSFLDDSNKGYGYWFSAQYLFPETALSVFSRYEYIDPSTTTSNDGRGRFVAGGVLPIDPRQYMRLTAEYVNDNPQGTGPSTNAFVAEVQLAL